ncbi:GntR family transcriptional regulator [Bordetella genomosp. 9]|uniref:GntR family transcriptional regulator n=1 Tax=Bordetella genomosp. 9 TaxID=1416803 RepID=A0A261RMT0_9BORD|nr:GntR family transcriptional regulator [Bordetella genomosp. 9]OZI26087.1 GntR family transcriptional regulator [Bordetella genomosp. 9]
MKASERIRSDIEQRILEGTLLPGTPVDELGLIAEYGVSKTPVREALLQLQAQGLLDSLPRGGMVVAKLDVQELLHMWELMADMEGLCARYACDRMTTSERQALAALHERSAGERDNVRKWRETDLEFHEMLYHGARNPYLREAIMRIRARTAAYRMHAAGATGRLQASYSQHAMVVNAILAGDGPAAARAMVEHMSPGLDSREVTTLIVNLPKALLR